MEMELGDSCELNSQGVWPASQEDAAFDDVQQCFFDESAFAHDELEPQPCPMLDVFGPEDDWQGKRYIAVEYAGRVRGILCLHKWPMYHLLAMCSTQHLLMLATTCRRLRRAASRLLDTRAQDSISRKYFGDSQLINFVDAFGFFGWAMSLSNWLTTASMQTWRAEELNAAYDFLAQHVDIDEVEDLRGLRPHAALLWRVEGRRALENFIRDCVASPATHRKLLAHYDGAWKSIRKIMELNASLIKTRSFAGSYSVVRQIQASWPAVTVDVDILEDAQASWQAHAAAAGVGPDVCTWSSQDVKNWLRLKKLPVRNVLELDFDGEALLRSCLAEASDKAAQKQVRAPFPHGLGMGAVPWNRCRFLVQQMVARAGAPMRSESFIFRFGERKAG